MNLKFLTFALISGMAAAHDHHDHPHEHPNCTIGTDTQDCTLPDGGAGMFLCHPHGPHGNHSHHEEGGGGGITGSLLRVVDRMAGHLPHPMHDEMDHTRGEGHGHHGHHVRGEDKGPHRQLRTGSSSSSSSISSSSSSSSGMMRSGMMHSGRSGGMMMMGRSGGMGMMGSSRRGSKGHHHHHGGMMMSGGRSGGHHHGGPMGRSGGHMGPHGGRGPPGFLSETHCVPVDGPPKDHPFPFHPPHGEHHPHHGDGAGPTCGCCGDVCPAKLDCACTCDLTDWDGTVVEKDAGVWVTVTLKDETTPVKKCVHAGAYADANRIQCVTECSADMVEDKNAAVELLEEHFGDDMEELEEKESRD